MHWIHLLCYWFFFCHRKALQWQSILFSPHPLFAGKNSKRELGKALVLLHAYALGPCCSRPGVCLTVSNQMDKGFVMSSTDLISVLDSFFKPEICADGRIAGTPSTRAFVTTLWDPKALDNIVDHDLTSSVDWEKHALKRLRRGYLICLRHTLIAKSSQSQDTETVLLEVKDFVSKFSVGYGRSGTSRQFLYVNSRPCSLSKV